MGAKSAQMGATPLHFFGSRNPDARRGSIPSAAPSVENGCAKKALAKNIFH
jgi:hypothetical protein